MIVASMNDTWVYICTLKKFVHLYIFLWHVFAEIF